MREDDKAGGSTPSQYGLPAGATDLQDLIEYREMNFAIGNIFKACYRRGTCSHSDELRDARKMLWFAQREVDRLEGRSDEMLHAHSGEVPKGCPTCKYHKRQAWTKPCRDCSVIHPGGKRKNNWMSPAKDRAINQSRLCVTCRYRWEASEEEPCRSCVESGQDVKINWEAKATEVENHE